MMTRLTTEQSPHGPFEVEKSLEKRGFAVDKRRCSSLFAIEGYIFSLGCVAFAVLIPDAVY